MRKIISKIAGLMLGLSLAAGVGVSFANHKTDEARATEVTDTITADNLAATSTTYTAFSGVSLTSDAVYAGNSAKTSSGGIQLRSKNSNSGIVSTTSGGTVKSVTITVASGSNTVDVYGSNTAYKAASDLYGTSQGTKVGSTSTTGTITFTDSYSYVGVRSNNGALYLTSVEIVWDDGQGGETTTCTVTYDANGGSGTITDGTEYDSGDTVTVLSNSFTAPDNFHEFVSFNTKADGSGTSYSAGDTFSITKNVTLYAIWDIIDVELGNGSYSATFPFVAAGYPKEIAVNNASSQQVGLIEVEATGLARYSSYNEYELQVTGSLIFKNHTNAPLTKVIVNVYQYDNFKLSLGSTVLHTGTGTKGSGDPVVFEITPSTPSTDDVKIEHYSGTGSYTQKLYSVELYFKIGSDVVHPSSVSLNSESGNVYIGKTRQLSATVLPADADDKTVSWSSSDTSVATVDSTGLVSGVAAGSTTITATTTDGGLTATFTATVKTLSYGTSDSPLSVEEAREVLEINGSSASSEQLYIRGTVYSSNYDSTKGYTIWLKSSDGTTNKYFEVFKAALDSSITDDYTASNALKDYVITARGYGMVYSGTTYELTPANSVNPSVLVANLSLDSFCEAIISETKSTCDAYVDGETDFDTQKATLTTIWSSLELKYNKLSSQDKIDIVSINADKSGNDQEKAMARYDFLTAKYSLTNFITGRTPVLSVGSNVVNFVNTNTNSSTTIIIVVALTSITSIGVLLVIKRKRSLIK